MFAPAIKRPWNYTRTSPVKQPQTQCGNFYVAKADAVYRWPLNEILAQNVGEYEKLGEQPDVGKSQNQSREWSICLGITLPIANTCGPNIPLRSLRAHSPEIALSWEQSKYPQNRNVPFRSSNEIP